ncbi:hypothetical protein AK88_00460 [Plasmodium fragile]|uniref:Uncharacterized protein n=1 Tax=Plasmodium fragile TaxID=5857 RepID=A0A0D9QSH5_PLAFR|nr:uncharacterized protein AK88_00460 [Plasmodium fragile]KJP89752.1 hypothetical protein AK88_00460 [Plasmodium fragile]
MPMLVGYFTHIIGGGIGCGPHTHTPAVLKESASKDDTTEMMNLEKDKQVLKERLQEELQRLRGGRERGKRRSEKKKKKKGILYTQIESKYIGKILYDTFCHSRGARRYNKCYPFQLCCVKRKIHIGKESKQIVVRWTDRAIPTETAFQLIRREKDFFIFLKITHYVKKELLGKAEDGSLSPLIVFLYDVATAGRDGIDKRQTERQSGGCTHDSLTNVGCQNGGNFPLPQLDEVQGGEANSKREPPPSKGDSKKFVDRYLLLVHYRTYHKVTLSPFLNSLISAKFNHSQNRFHLNSTSTQEQHRGHNEWKDNGSTLSTPHRRVITVHLKNDITGKVCHSKKSNSLVENVHGTQHRYTDGDVGNARDQVDLCITTPLSGKQRKWLKFYRPKKYKYYPSPQNETNCAEQIYQLLKEPNCHIHIYTCKMERGKEIFLTFHKMTKSFFVFISPILGILNGGDQYQIVCLSNELRKDTTPTECALVKERVTSLPPPVITSFLEELSHSIRVMYKQKKKLIRKLQKYLTNRTLKGYIKFRRFGKNVQNKQKIYSYTFYDIEDNFFLAKEEYSTEVITGDPQRRHQKYPPTQGIPNLLHKIEPILTQCNLFNPKVDVHFAQRRLEQVCTNVTHMLTWCRQFRMSIRWTKRSECICVYFVRKDFPPILNTNWCGRDGPLMECTTGYTHPSPSHKNDKNTGTENQQKKSLQQVQLLYAFQVLSTRGIIFKIMKRVCFLLFSLSHKREKFANWDLVHMLRHVHHVVVAFPYLYVCYAQEGRSSSVHTSTREKRNGLGQLSLAHFHPHAEGLQRLKRKRKKAIRRIFLKEGEFPFLLKMHKLLLYFYLYVIGNLCQTWLNNAGGSRGTPKQGGEKATCKEALQRSRFDEFIKQIKREKWKKKIYLYLRNGMGVLLKRDKKGATHTGEQLSNKSHILERGARGTKGTFMNTFILRPVCMDEHFSGGAEATPEGVRGDSGVDYEEVLSAHRATAAKTVNAANAANAAKPANMGTPLNSRGKSPMAHAEKEDYANFFKLRNMKKTVRILGPALMDKMADKLYVGRNALLNVNAHRVELLGIVNQFEEEAKGVLLYVREALSHRGDIITTSQHDHGDPPPNLNEEEVQRLLHHICKKKRVNKNLSIFNIPGGCTGRGKLRHVSKAKVNNKVVKSFFRLEKCPHEKRPLEESIRLGNRSGTHKVALKYLVHFVNGHITFAVNIFSKNHQKWGHSTNRVYFLNVCKNDVLKNMLIEKTIHFLEDLLTYVQENLPFVENEKTHAPQTHHFSYNVCKIFCYELKQGKCDMKKIYKVKPEGEFYVHLFTLTSQATAFLYSTGVGGGLCNPFFVKFFEPSKFYDAFVESVNGVI